MTKYLVYKIYIYIGKSSSGNLRWVIYYTSDIMDPKKHVKTQMFAQQSQTSENHTARRPFGSTNKNTIMANTVLYKIYREILFQKVALGYLLHFVQNDSSKNILKHLLLLHSKSHKSDTYTARLPFGSTTSTHNFMTKSNLCKIYREILFQKVASGYLLHFVHNGSSKTY